MKAYLLLVASALLLTVCGGPTDSDAAHAAVTAYLRKNMNDPGSYEAARWGSMCAGRAKIRQGQQHALLASYP